MTFGFATPIHTRPLVPPALQPFPQMNLTQPGPAGFVPQLGMGDGKAMTFNDMRTGLQKMIGGQPQGGPTPSGDQGAPMGAPPPPVAYTPPTSVADTNMGPMMGSAMAGAPAAGAPAIGADAAGAGAAGASGSLADIGAYLSAFLGL